MFVDMFCVGINFHIVTIITFQVITFQVITLYNFSSYLNKYLRVQLLDCMESLYIGL